MSTSDVNTASTRKYNPEEEGYEWKQHVTRFAMMEHPAISEAFVTDKYPEPPHDADDKEQRKFKKAIAEARIKATVTIQKNITDGCLAVLRRTPAWTDAELKRDPVAMLKAATAKMITPHLKRHYLVYRKTLEIMIQEVSGNVYHTIDKIEAEMQRVKFYNNNMTFSSDDLERWYEEFLTGALNARRFAVFHSEEIRTAEPKDLLGVMKRVKDWTQRNAKNMEKPSDPPSGPTPTLKPIADASTHSALFSKAPTNPNKKNQGTERACSRCGKTGHGRGSCRGPVWCKKCDNTGKSNFTCSSHATEVHRDADGQDKSDKKGNEPDRRSASKKKEKQDIASLNFIAHARTKRQSKTT